MIYSGDGGVRKLILKEGSVLLPRTENINVNVHYIGRLEDGTEFDSSRSRGRPFTFALGEYGLFAGLLLSLAIIQYFLKNR